MKASDTTIAAWKKPPLFQFHIQDTTFHRIVGENVFLSIGQQQLLTDSLSDMIITVFPIHNFVPTPNTNIVVTLWNRGRTYYPVGVNSLTRRKFRVTVKPTRAGYSTMHIRVKAPDIKERFSIETEVRRPSHQ